MNKLEQNCYDICFKYMNLDKSKNKVIVYDDDTKLAVDIKDAYLNALPDAKVVNFNSVDHDKLKQELYELNEGDYVFLVQSSSFRLSDYRIRLDLTNRKIYCVEHARLSFLSEEQYDYYVNSLTFDKPRHEAISKKFESLLKDAQTIKVISKSGDELVYTDGFEDQRNNMGDFTKSLGSFFPIGEVFTEPLKLDAVNGKAKVYAYPNLNHRVNICEPFEIEITDGCIISHSGPDQFDELLELIRNENNDGKIPFREMGFGMNRFITVQKPLADATSFERLNGFHISLGLKHNIYRKKIPKGINQRYHIDIYLETDKIFIDDNLIFESGEYIY